jgi:hypothetical protein
MKRERMEFRRPYGRGDYALHRGNAGVYWRTDHGVLVHMAAADREAEACIATSPGGKPSPEVGPARRCGMQERAGGAGGDMHG